MASTVEDAESHDAFCNSQHEMVMSNTLLSLLPRVDVSVQQMVLDHNIHKTGSVQRLSKVLSPPCQCH